MGIFQYVDSQTGKGYDFTISGENPSDVEFAKIAQILQQDREEDLKAYKDRYGEDLYVDDGTALGRGGARGFQQVKQAVGETIGTIGEQTGLGFLENYGTGVEERAGQQLGRLSLEQPKRLQSTDVDSIGSALTYAGEVVGSQIPQLGLGIAGAGAAALAAPVLGAGALGTSLLSFGAYGLAQVPILLGNDIQRQEDEVAAGRKDRVDLSDALLATFGQATLESISGKLLLGSLFKPAGKSLFTRTASRFGGGSATESFTEVGQQIIERAQAGLPIDNDEAIAEYREAAIAGGLIGGATRSTLGALTGERGTTKAIPTKTAVKTETGTQSATPIAPALDPKKLTPAQEEVSNNEGKAKKKELLDAKEKIDEYSADKDRGKPIDEDVEGVDGFDAIPATIRNSTDLDIDRLNREEIAPVKPTVSVTNEMLDELGVFSQASIRRTLVDKPLNDPDVQASLRKYVQNSLVRAKVPDIDARLEALLDAGLETGDKSGDERTGGSVSGGAVSVANDGDESGKRGNTGASDPLNAVPVGTSVPNSNEPRGSEGSEPNTLDINSVRAVLSRAQKRADAGEFNVVSKEGIKVLVDAGLVKEADAVTSMTAQGSIRKLLDMGPEGVNAALAQAQADKAMAKDFLEEDQEFEGNEKSAAQEIALENLEDQVDDIVTEPIVSDAGQGAETLTGQLIPGTKIPTDPKTLEPIGEPFFVDDPYYAPTPPVDTEAQAPDSYDAMLDAPDVSQEVLNSQAQEALDARFFAPQKTTIEGTTLTKAREFHESDEGKALFNTGDADPTTFEDKQAVLSLLDAPATKEDRAAAAFFSKYRRLDVALDQIGALSKIGFGKNAVSIKTVADAKKVSAENAFYFNQTKRRAIPARVWVENNMSPQANSIMKSASELYGRDTSASILSDEQRVENRENAADQKDARREYNKKRNAHNFEIITDDKAILDDGVEFIDDSIIGYDLDAEFFLLDPVQGLNTQLLPDAKNGLRNNNIRAVLLSIAGTNPVPRVRQIASKLADVVGTTQVQVVDDLSTMVGRKAAGMFRPETNTIFIDANIGMDVHTVLHEMAHATTSAALANPNLPEVKQLQVLLKAAREQLGDVYGTKNLDEFVAEAFGNPEFQAALALMSVDGGKMAGWKKFASAVMRTIRKAIGFKPKPLESPLDDIDNIIMGMLTPSPATRGVPDMLLLGRTAKGAYGLLREHVTAVPLKEKSVKGFYEQQRDFVGANSPRKLRQFVLAVQPVTTLARLAVDRISFAPELNTLINKKSGALREAFEPIQVLFNDYRAYKKSNRAGYDKMLPLMNRATQDEVDPAMPQSTYEKYWMSYYDLQAEKTILKVFDTGKERDAEIKKLNDDLVQKYGGQTKPRTSAKKAGDPSSEKVEIWKTLNKEYKQLGPEGHRLYKVTRNMGQAAQDRIIPSIRARIASLGVDESMQLQAFEELAEFLHAQGGVIRPYFKLGRGQGDFRLSYRAPDPLRNGGIELFTEYYNTERQLMQGKRNVEKYLRDVGRAGDINKIESGLRDMKRQYDKAPSNSFVFQVLSRLQKVGVEKEAIDQIIDLALDTIPERSFMQSFRSRKERSKGNRGILGALGDVTPSGMPGMEVDLAYSFRENFRGIEKQLITLKFNSEIQGWRNKLADPDSDYFTNPETRDIAEKMDQIAKFSQNPSMAQWSQVATSMGFTWTMGANLSSALNVTFDIPMAVHPYLAGEYGGAKATSAIAKATKLFMGSPSKKLVTIMGEDGNPEVREVELGVHNKGMDNHNYDDPDLDPDILRYKTLNKMAGEQGMFNQTIDQEHVDLSDKRDTLAKANQVTGFLVHHGERFGRQISLTAAFDLELDNLTTDKDGNTRPYTLADEVKAAEKAMKTAELTLGSTASAGRPVWAQNPWGNVAFLFKRFAVSRYYFMNHLVDQALGGADANTRRIARNQLAYFGMSVALFAGTRGLPMMGAIAVGYNMFTEDGEDDFETKMRKLLPGTVYNGIANELLGIELADRVSMNSLLYRQPFVDKDQFAGYTLLEQLGGPVAGLVTSNIPRSVKLWGEGDYQRSFEAFAPAALRNVSKFQRFSTEGANTMRGDPIMDDINPYNSFMQLLGFAPADYVENLSINSGERRKQNAVDDKRRKLMRRHNMARSEGDTGARREALAAIRAYNAALPADFKKEKITQESLRKSYTGFLTTTGKMINGIVYTDAMRKSFKDYE